MACAIEFSGPVSHVGLIVRWKGGCGCLFAKTSLQLCHNNTQKALARRRHVTLARSSARWRMRACATVGGGEILIFDYSEGDESGSSIGLSKQAIKRVRTILKIGKFGGKWTLARLS